MRSATSVTFLFILTNFEYIETISSILVARRIFSWSTSIALYTNKVNGNAPYIQTENDEGYQNPKILHHATWPLVIGGVLYCTGNSDSTFSLWSDTVLRITGHGGCLEPSKLARIKRPKISKGIKYYPKWDDASKMFIGSSDSSEKIYSDWDTFLKECQQIFTRFYKVPP